MFAPASPNTLKKQKRLSTVFCINEVASSIQRVLLASTNEEFRQSAFRALSVNNTQDAKCVLKRKLCEIMDVTDEEAIAVTREDKLVSDAIEEEHTLSQSLRLSQDDMMERAKNGLTPPELKAWLIEQAKKPGSSATIQINQ